MSPEDQIRMLRMLPNATVRSRPLPIPSRPEHTGAPFGDGTNPFPPSEPSPEPRANTPGREYRAEPQWEPKMIVGVDGTPVPSWSSRPHTMDSRQKMF